MSELDWRFNCSPEEIEGVWFPFRKSKNGGDEVVKLTTRRCTHHDWLNSVQDDSADYPIVCDSYSDKRPEF